MIMASNGEISITGDLRFKGDLEDTLEFVLKKMGVYKSLCDKDSDSECVFQITEDGRYCIGRAWNEKEHWTPYPFDFDVNIVASIIRQHLLKQKMQYEDEGDGSYEHGYKITSMEDTFSNEYKGVKNPHYCIAIFEPFTCFYAK